jgi:hypothetical protein
VASFDRAGWEERAESGPTSKPGLFSVVDGNSDGKIDLEEWEAVKNEMKV